MTWLEQADQLIAGAEKAREAGGRRRAEEKAMTSEKRLMKCPRCGHTTTTKGIGAVHCGPHGTGDRATPAVQMVEQCESSAIEAAEAERAPKRGRW